MPHLKIKIPQDKKDRKELSAIKILLYILILTLPIKSLLHSFSFQTIRNVFIDNVQIIVLVLLCHYKSIIFGSDEDIIIENAANQGLNGWILDDINARVGGFTGLELEVLRLMLKALLEAGRP